MRINNPMAFIQQMMSSGKNPQQMMKEMMMQNPSQYNSAMKQIEAMKNQGLTPQQALMQIVGNDNPIFQMLKNFGIIPK